MKQKTRNNTCILQGTGFTPMIITNKLASQFFCKKTGDFHTKSKQIPFLLRFSYHDTNNEALPSLNYLYTLYTLNSILIHIMEDRKSITYVKTWGISRTPSRTSAQQLLLTCVFCFIRNISKNLII